VGRREPENAQEAALRVLRHRDLSVRELDARLRDRGYPEAERDDAIDALLRTGLLDDRRFAESRARSLAARGSGDALIRHELGRAGTEPEAIHEALSVLEPETERARAIVARRGAGPKAARYLAGKGFSEDAIAAAVATATGRELG
jgi:SOS response regulatory protein OraA/RecX